MTRKKGKVKAKARKKAQASQKRSHDMYIKQLLARIKKYDDPVLLELCKEVPSGTDVKSIIKQMGKVLAATETGVGLAASQIGITKRIIALRPDVKVNDISFMINPVIIYHSEEKKYSQEGCLSYPGVRGFVKRYTSITVEYFNEDWQEKEVSYKEGDFKGILVQHEIDHLEEGHCAIYDWWKDPEAKRQELRNEFEVKDESDSSGGYEVEESEDMKREKEEELLPADREDSAEYAKHIHEGSQDAIKTFKEAAETGKKIEMDTVIIEEKDD